MNWWSILLYDFLILQIDTKNPWRDDVIQLLGNLPELTQTSFVTSGLASKKLPYLQIAYKPELPLNGLREIGNKQFVSRNLLLDNNYKVQLTCPSEHLMLIETSGAGLEWLIWALQLLLLRNKATFVHAAGVAKNGKALLFPSWGGVGKTALVNSFVQDMQWDLLGDDLVILSSEGVCYGFPKPMVIYPYHRSVFPELFARNEGPIAPTIFNNALTRMVSYVKPILRSSPKILQFARNHNPQSIRINPADVFGLNKIAKFANLQSIIWLDRVKGISEIELIPGKHNLVSRIVGSTVREFDPWCVQLSNIMFGLGMLSFSDIYVEWANTLEKGIYGKDGWTVYIPEAMPLRQVPGAVQAVLQDAGILETF